MQRFILQGVRSRSVPHHSFRHCNRHLASPSLLSPPKLLVNHQSTYVKKPRGVEPNTDPNVYNGRPYKTGTPRRPRRSENRVLIPCETEYTDEEIKQRSKERIKALLIEEPIRKSNRDRSPLLIPSSVENILSFIRKFPDQKLGISKWNMAIERCVKEKDWESANLIFKHIETSGTRPTVATFRNLLKAGLRSRRVTIDQTKDLVKLATEKYDIIIDDITYKNVLRLCLQLKDMEYGTEIFSKITDRHCLARFRHERYTIMVDLCGKMQKPDEAMSYFQMMLSNNIKPTRFDYSRLLGACKSNIELLDNALEMLLSQLDSVEPDRPLYNFAMYAAIRCGRLDTVEELYGKSLAEFSPDVITYNIIISACAEHRDVARAEALFKELQKSEKLEADSFTYNNMLSVYEAVGDFKSCFTLYRKIPKQHLTPVGHFEVCRCAALHGNVREMMILVDYVLNNFTHMPSMLCIYVTRRLVKENQLELAEKYMHTFVRKGHMYIQKEDIKDKSVLNLKLFSGCTAVAARVHLQNMIEKLYSDGTEPTEQELMQDDLRISRNPADADVLEYLSSTHFDPLLEVTVAPEDPGTIVISKGSLNNYILSRKNFYLGENDQTVANA